jgi:hypothetical protein
VPAGGGPGVATGAEDVEVLTGKANPAVLAIWGEAGERGLRIGGDHNTSADERCADGEAFGAEIVRIERDLHGDTSQDQPLKGR